ncbi:hypothetical protein ACQPX6_12145 [Actinomycetospora sp. CA-101289]|uniref:hypothetical protein n=1 Tax=Actinomycetospora sp. CA-101289 TaxID=3239893 RepID=UPI003D997DD4
MTAARSEAVWHRLNESHADGTECVMCERSFGWPELPAQFQPDPVPGIRTGPAGIAGVPVGCSHTGSQVFACVGICSALAYPD